MYEHFLYTKHQGILQELAAKAQEEEEKKENEESNSQQILKV